MNETILSEAGAFRHIKDYLILYELQHCGSLYAYIILWIEKYNVERITDEITTTICCRNNSQQRQNNDMVIRT
jgi:hypothetical protein